jgi:hypothetical protein
VLKVICLIALSPFSHHYQGTMHESALHSGMTTHISYLDHVRKQGAENLPKCFIDHAELHY